MKKMIVIFLLSILGTTAMADQCAYITQAQAEKAVKLLLDASKIQELCEPCGGIKAETLTVQSLGYRKINKQYSEVVINEKGIDLAYTFINGLNLAQLTGCPTQDVSSAIQK